MIFRIMGSSRKTTASEGFMQFRVSRGFTKRIARPGCFVGSIVQSWQAPVPHRHGRSRTKVKIRVVRKTAELFAHVDPGHGDYAHETTAPTPNALSLWRRF